jgi:DNA-binding NarL/FixJ family response regulator
LRHAEFAVLRRVASGETNEPIPAALLLSERTVDRT